MNDQDWYTIDNAQEIETPALLIYPKRIEQNIQTCMAIAGDVSRLRPHVKTHKLPQVIQMHVSRGIKKFKCATLAEAQMLAENGAKDILMAYPLYGPAREKYIRLALQYPAVSFAFLVDQMDSLNAWEALLQTHQHRMKVFPDIDSGMGRTGIAPNAEAFELYQAIVQSAWLAPGGLHIYDGHIRKSNLDERKAEVAEAYASVEPLISRINAAGFPLPELICGGSPSFPVHAEYPERTLSPGTYVFWDAGYASLFPDMDFAHAAVLLTRVISRPSPTSLCLDLGHKALASEMPHPRVHFFAIPEYTTEVHSEEHLVISCKNARDFAPGDCLYGIPKHICPTTALYEDVWVVEDAKANYTWKVTARKRLIEV